MTLTRSRYASVAVILHWVIAALILFMITMGWRLEADGPNRYALYQLHKSVGISILLLSLLRLGLRFFMPPPPALPGPAWQTGAAHLVHVLFYVIMIGIPVSGWAIVSASKLGTPTVLFGVIPWPHLPLPRSDGLHNAAVFAHGLFIKLTYGLVILHVGAALKHHLIDKDMTLARMAPGVKAGQIMPPIWIWPLLLVGGAALAGQFVLSGPASKPVAEAASGPLPVESEAPAAPAVVPTTPPAQDAAAQPAPDIQNQPVPQWTLDRAASKLGFSTEWSGAPITGTFSAWRGDIAFDPDQLDKSRVQIRIDLTSVNTDDSSRDEALKGPEWFDTAAHKTAVFDAATFRKTGKDRYEAVGSLTIRGRKQPLTLPFTLQIRDKVATMQATVTIDRLAFGVGQGQWEQTDQIPAKVTVTTQVRATRKDP